MDSLTTAYQFQGFQWTVTAPPGFAAAIERHLSHCRSHPGPVVHFEFHFREIRGQTAEPLRRPAAPGRPVLQLPRAEAFYYPDADQLWIDAEGRAQALCDLPACRFDGTYRSTPDEPFDRMGLRFLSHSLFELLKRRGHFPLHSAGLCTNDHGILIPGTSGTGKTTLALTLLRSGFDFLGDDAVLLNQTAGTVTALAFPEEVNVTDETAAFFPELEALRSVPRRPGFAKRQICVETSFGARPARQCTPRLLVFPRVGNTGSSDFQPITPAEAFLELVPNVVLTEPRSSQAHLDALARLAHQAPAWRLTTGRDLPALPLRFRALLEGSCRH